MSVSGIVTVKLTGLGEIVFFVSGAPLPETFDDKECGLARGSK
ncbi:hypothetical protein CRYPA_752 [uncultured Candidatus Thioglobus sp.]|nr:hypothetical protein CRYPA_752 [uncultured Candidatus Thioglobus sp.]